MKKANKFVLALLSIGLALACGGCRTNKPSTPPDVPTTDDPTSILDELDYNPQERLNYDDKAYYYNEHINDVEPDAVIKITPHPSLSDDARASAFAEISTAEDLSPYVEIFDRDGGAVTLQQYVLNGEVCHLTPKGDANYKPGEIYKAVLHDENFVFEKKSPNIRKLYFDVKRDDALKMGYSDNIRYFDISKVSQFAPKDTEELLDPSSEEAKDWFENHTYEMVYRTNDFSSLSEGDNFAVCPYDKGEPYFDDRNSFFGKFVSSEQVEGGYKVTYKNVDLFEIYGVDENDEHPVDVYMNETLATEFRNVRSIFDEEKVREEIINDPEYNRVAMAMIMAAGQTNEYTPYDILSRIKVSPTFSYNAPTFVFQLKLSAYVDLNEDKTAALQVEFIYQYTSTLSVGASYELKKFWGIPYSLKVSGETTQTVENKVQVKICLMRNFKPEEKDTSDMQKMVKNAYDKLENDPAYFMNKTGDEATITGNTKAIPIAELNIPFGGVFSFYVSFEFVLTLDLNVMFEYAYVSTYTERVLSFSTDDGIENTANTDSISSSCHTFTFIGNFGVEFGLRIRIGICITGLSNLFGFGIAFEGGVYFSLKGMVGLTIGENQDPEVFGGVGLEVGLYGKITGYIDFLVFHPKYDFAYGKLPLVGYEKPFTVIDLAVPTDINLSEKVTPVENMAITTAKTFASDTLEIGLRTFSLNEVVQIDYFGTIREITPVTVTSNSNYLIVNKENSMLQIPDKAPASFDCELQVSVDPNLISFCCDHDLNYKVKVHYYSKDAHTVKIAGASNKVLSEKGRNFILPDAEVVPNLGSLTKCELEINHYTFDVQGKTDFQYDNTFYDFFGYTDGVNTYNPGDEVPIGDSDLTITPILKVIVYYVATFYNGKNEIISTSRVREHTDAVEPSMEDIMRNMDGYTFYGWDRSFKALKEDIDVYGIYYKVGE